MAANYVQNRRLAWRVGDGTKIYCWKGRRVYGMIVIDHALPSLSNTNFGKEKQVASIYPSKQLGLADLAGMLLVDQI